MTMDQDLWTYEAVEERLIEAWLLLHRMPDREAAWLGQTVMSLWRQVRREWGAYSQDGDDVRLTLGARAAEVDRMDEALDWLGHVRPIDRKLVGLVIKIKARGYGEVPWALVRAKLGWEVSADACRKRYGRAIYGISHKLNRAFSGA
jgi:hypothetical protein